LQADPSDSQTLLELNYGKLSGHVKNLRPNSSFDVDTPLGTAAIRGTTWSAMLFYNAERGEFLLTVKNFEGEVDIISRYIGQLEFGRGNIADKSYEPSITEVTREPIPEEHTVVIRLRDEDPYFNDLFDRVENYLPEGPQPVITPGPSPDGPGPEPDDDLGIIVVSPETP
jgi:hypothetical protein